MVNLSEFLHDLFLEGSRISLRVDYSGNYSSDLIFAAAERGFQKFYCSSEIFISYFFYHLCLFHGICF